MRLTTALLMAISLFAPTAVLAHEAGHGGHGGHAMPAEAGSPGKASEATRVVTIVATDSAFSPNAVAVKAGETVRFIVRNDGKLVHELTIGSKAMQLEHQSEMLGFAVSGAIGLDSVDRAKLGAHDHGNNVLLEPGKTGEIVWTFAKATELEFGCNVPGHYDAGMLGAFKFE